MKRPKSVTLLAIGVLILAGYYIVRTVLAASQWEFLSILFTESLIPHYLVLTGLIWGIAGLILGWSLFTGRHWASRLFKILALVFAGYWWLDNLFLAADPAVRGSIPFRLVATIALLALAFWILSRSGAKSFFGELND